MLGVEQRHYRVQALKCNQKLGNPTTTLILRSVPDDANKAHPNGLQKYQKQGNQGVTDAITTTAVAGRDDRNNSIQEAQQHNDSELNERSGAGFVAQF